MKKLLSIILCLIFTQNSNSVESNIMGSKCCCKNRALKKTKKLKKRKNKKYKKKADARMCTKIIEQDKNNNILLLENI